MVEPSVPVSVLVRLPDEVLRADCTRCQRWLWQSFLKKAAVIHCKRWVKINDVEECKRAHVSSCMSRYHCYRALVEYSCYR